VPGMRARMRADPGDVWIHRKVAQIEHARSGTEQPCPSNELGSPSVEFAARIAEGADVVPELILEPVFSFHDLSRRVGVGKISQRPVAESVRADLEVTADCAKLRLR